MRPPATSPLPSLHGVRFTRPLHVTFTPEFTVYGVLRIYHLVPSDSPPTCYQQDQRHQYHQDHQRLRDIYMHACFQQTNQHTNKSRNQQTRTSTSTSMATSTLEMRLQLRLRVIYKVQTELTALACVLFEDLHSSCHYHNCGCAGEEREGICQIYARGAPGGRRYILGYSVTGWFFYNFSDLNLIELIYFG